MEADHCLLAGGGTETLRGSSAADARHLAESPYSAASRIDERWDCGATTDRRYPFLLTVRDELGKLIATFPILSQADADAILAELRKGVED